MAQLELARCCLAVHALDLRRLLGALLVCICVLLEAGDAVRDLRPPEAREQQARLDAADVHHRTVQTLRDVEDGETRQRGEK